MWGREEGSLVIGLIGRSYCQALLCVCVLRERERERERERCVGFSAADLLAPSIRSKVSNAQRTYKLWAGERSVCVCVCVLCYGGERVVMSVCAFCTTNDAW